MKLVLYEFTGHITNHAARSRPVVPHSCPCRLNPCQKTQESYGEGPRSIASTTNHAIASYEGEAPMTMATWTPDDMTSGAKVRRQEEQADKDVNRRNSGPAIEEAGKTCERAGRARGEARIARSDDGVAVGNDRWQHQRQQQRQQQYQHQHQQDTTAFASKTKTINVHMYSGGAAGTHMGGIAAMAGCFGESRAAAAAAAAAAEAAAEAAATAAASMGKDVSRYGGRFSCEGRRVSTTVTDSGVVMIAVPAHAPPRALHMSDAKQVSAPFAGYGSMTKTIAPGGGFMSKDNVRQPFGEVKLDSEA